MRSLELLTLAAIIGLVGAVVWQGGHWFPGQSVLATSAPTLPVRPPVSKEVKAVPGKVAKNPGRHNVAPAMNESAALSLPPDLNSAKIVVTPPLGIPDSEALAIGTTSSELRERYGVPSVAVESVREGSLVERYYYVKADHANMVVANLRDGKLVSAQTSRVWLPRHDRAAQSAQ
jgi:hypothetical protein